MQKTFTGEECARCETFVVADSDKPEDMPEGYYLKLRRVTQAHKHSQVHRVFLCSKDCLIAFCQYEISHYAEPIDPREI